MHQFPPFPQCQSTAMPFDAPDTLAHQTKQEIP